MKIPQISGQWQLLFKPEKHGNYVNDHSVVVGSDGKWHLYGIITSVMLNICRKRITIINLDLRQRSTNI